MNADLILAVAGVATLIAAPGVAFVVGLVCPPPAPYFMRPLDEIPDGALIVDGGELR